MSGKMDEFKLCSDGEFMPVNLPCPPPYSGPYYYYPFENIPLPPEQGISDSAVSSSSNAGSAISSGAVAGIIIIVGFIFFMMCLIALKFRSRFIMGRRVSSSRAARNPAGLSGELLVSNAGDMQLVNVVGSGLEEKLVNLLPVCQYVGLVQEGIKERHHECAVCLSFFEEKEMVRVLPKCHHIFHLHCIDKWFESHANCPLCRERITLQTIQLSFSTPDHHKHDDDHHPHLPPPPPPPRPPSSDAPFLLHAHHQPDGSLPCHLHDPLPHQNIFLSAASATNVITNPHTAEAPPDHTAASADARKLDAGFTCGFESLCDHNPFLIPAVTAESTKYIRHDAESEEEYRVARINQAATRESTFAKEARAIYIGDDQSAGSISGLQMLNDRSNRAAAVSDRSVGGSVHGEEAADEYRIVGISQRRSLLVDQHKKLQEVQNAGEIDDEKTAGITSNCEAEDQSLLAIHGVELKSAHQRLLSILVASPHPKSRSPLSLLRRSLSTGCLIESDAKASHATDPHGTTLYEML